MIRVAMEAWTSDTRRRHPTTMRVPEDDDDDDAMARATTTTTTTMRKRRVARGGRRARRREEGDEVGAVCDRTRPRSARRAATRRESCGVSRATSAHFGVGAFWGCFLVKISPHNRAERARLTRDTCDDYSRARRINNRRNRVRRSIVG